MLVRKSSSYTPEIVLNETRLLISGKLWMENPAEYFEEIFDSTSKYIKGDFEATIEVDHMNSSSIKHLVMYFKLLKKLKREKQISSLKINWILDSEDEEHISMVNDISWITGVKISIKKHSTNNE